MRRQADASRGRGNWRGGVQDGAQKRNFIVVHIAPLSLSIYYTADARRWCSRRAARRGAARRGHGVVVRDERYGTLPR